MTLVEAKRLNYDLSTGGEEKSLSQGKYGELLVSQFGPRLFEAVRSGRVFVGGTAATGVAPGTAVGTTAAFTLANPSGSRVSMVVLKVTCAYVSGTLGAGVIHYVGNVNPAAAEVTGTAITVSKTYLSQSSAGNKGLAFTTATLPATPTVLRPFASLTALLASTAVAPYVIEDKVDGEFVIAPGCSLSLEATAAAGSTPLVCYGATWLEVAE